MSNYYVLFIERIRNTMFGWGEYSDEECGRWRGQDFRMVREGWGWNRKIEKKKYSTINNSDLFRRYSDRLDLNRKKKLKFIRIKNANLLRIFQTYKINYLPI